MGKFFENRYARLGALMLGVAVLIYSLIWLVLVIFNVRDFPQLIQLSLSVLGAGLLVYKFLSQRVF